MEHKSLKKYNLDSLLNMPIKELQKFYQDLIKHSKNDFYQITADCMDPHLQSIIILEPQMIKEEASQDVIFQSYQNSIKTINSLNPDYHYPKQIQDETKPIIIFKEKENSQHDEIKVQQVIPFNLSLGFSLPIALNNPHILKDPLMQQVTPLVKIYVEHLLLNWLNLPWLIYYRLNHSDITVDKLYDHSLNQYQIILFDEGLTVAFDLNQNEDQEQFNVFLKDLMLPTICQFSPDQQHFLKLKINH